MSLFVVDRETITKLIDIARYAPSGHNSQPVRWFVIYDREEVRKLAGLVVDWMKFLIKKQYELAIKEFSWKNPGFNGNR